MAYTFTSFDDDLVKLLEEGAVGVLPTDTIYGIVCLASNKESVKRLYASKSRGHKPGTVIAANIEQLVEIGIKRRYLKAVEQFWPGPVSVEIANDLDYLNQGTGRQAFRVTGDKKLRSLLLKTGPLLTTSANHSGQQPANTVREAQMYFGNVLDFYVDGGDLSNREPSTILRIVDDAIEVVRKGAGNIGYDNVPKNEL